LTLIHDLENFLIKSAQAAYSRSVLSRFIQRVGEANLNKIIEEKVVNLLNRNRVRNIDAVFDASFIKAWRTRNPLDNQKGYFDIEARVSAHAESLLHSTAILYASNLKMPNLKKLR
jgi:hypothetical protein